MEQELYIEGIGIAHEVIDTIVARAVDKVPGVVSVGENPFSSGVKSLFGSKQPKNHSGIEVAVVDGTLALSVRLTVFYGYPFPALAEEVRQAVASAIRSQIGVGLSAVDVYIESIVIPKE